MKEKTHNNSALLMLGVAGLGLSIAMFLDARKQTCCDLPKNKLDSLHTGPDQEQEQVSEPESDALDEGTENLSMIPAINDTDFAEIEDHEIEEIVEEKRVEEERVEEERVEEDSRAGKPEVTEPKKLAFIEKLRQLKEAYAKSRQHTPIDPFIVKKVQMSKYA
jgi:hypothetical protein